MDNLDVKYFERVISELKKLRAEDDSILISQNFKGSLREGLLAKAKEMKQEELSFDWLSFLKKWKYTFGAVPALAVMTIVAVNMNNYQLKMQGSEYIPQQIADNASVKTSVVESDAALKSVRSVNDPEIVTFPAEKALPSNEVLEKYFAEKNSAGEMVEAQQINSGVEVLPKANLKLKTENIGEVKIANPKIDTYSFDFSGHEDALPKSRMADVPVEPTVNNIVERNNISSVDNGLENSVPRKENSYVVPAVNGNNSNISSNGVDSVSVDSRAVNATDVPQNNIAPSSMSGTVVSGGTVVDSTLNQNKELVPPVSESGVVLKNALVNSGSSGEQFGISETDAASSALVNRSLAKTRLGTAGFVVNTAKVNYSGNDFNVVCSAIDREFFGSGRGVSSDYRFQVNKTADGILKVVFVENNLAKKIVYFRLIRGEYVSVTEVDL